MNDVPQISEAELEVMKIVWKGDNLTAGQIVSALSEKSEWKPKTIHTLIKRLLEKGALAAIKNNSKVFLYSAAICEDEYKRFANESFLKKLYNGSLDLMLSTFIKDRKISEQELSSLRKILDGEE